MKLCFIVRALQMQQPRYTTIHLAFAALQAGCEVSFTSIDALIRNTNGSLHATGIRVPRDVNSRESLNSLLMQTASDTIDFSEMDRVFLRFNPHFFPQGYEPILEFASLLQDEGIEVINKPHGLRRASSKMYLSTIDSELVPPMLVSRQLGPTTNFIEKHGACVLKPLHGFGGKNVFLVTGPDDINLETIFESIAEGGYVLAQQYIEGIDKRILLYRGEPVFCGSTASVYRRISPKTEIRSNMTVGAKPKPTEYTEADARLVEKLQPQLLEDGLEFVGVDIIGNKVIELNVHCPGGIGPLGEAYGLDFGRATIERIGMGRVVRESKIRQDALQLST